jgi:hypothetical protein
MNKLYHRIENVVTQKWVVGFHPKTGQLLWGGYSRAVAFADRGVAEFIARTVGKVCNVATSTSIPESFDVLGFKATPA